MNNNGQMENIWHHIRKNTSRRAMRSLVKLEIVVWVVLLGLIGFCLYQGMQWWHLNADISNTIRSIRPTIDHQLKSLREDINLKMHRIAFLEEQALSSQNEDLISRMTEQAEVSKTQMIGVEHLKERQVEQYFYSPIEFTFRGDYQSLGKLVNQLERSQYPMKLDYLSVATRENSPESLIMNIVLCSISTIGEPITKIQKKEQFPAVSVPPQSSEHRFNYIGADFVYPKGNGMRDIFQPYYPIPQAKNEPFSPSLILTGVIYNENKPLAILMDGQNKSYLARVNDTILDFTVLKIEPRSVILNRGDTRTELKVFKNKEIGATF
ncbi:hypothetical protein H8E77_26120 [bacterium]|nr:hypothetical protein [bacterium]